MEGRVTMKLSHKDFESRLRDVLTSRIEGCQDLVSWDRLSGGASQETYRLEIAAAIGPRSLALRRAAGGVEAATSPKGINAVNGAPNALLTL